MTSEKKVVIVLEDTNQSENRRNEKIHRMITQTRSKYAAFNRKKSPFEMSFIVF